MILPPKFATALLLAAIPLLAASPVSADSRAKDLYCRELHLPEEKIAAPAPKPLLGVAFEPASPLESGGVSPCPKVARVTAVVKDSAASRAGLQPGDLILTLDGEVVCAEDGPEAAGLRASLGKRRVGETVAVALLRDGARREIAVRLGARPRHRAAEAPIPAPDCGKANSRLARLLEERGQTKRFGRVAAGLADRADQLHNLDPRRSAAGNPRQRREFTALMRHPLRAGLTARRLGDSFLAGEDEGHRKADDLESLAALADIEAGAAPAPREATLPALVAALEEASERIGGLLAGLSPDERQRLVAGALAPGDVEEWNRFVAASLKVDLAAMVEALAPLRGFLAGESLARLRQDLLRRFPETGSGLLYETRSAAGPILVGGVGNDTYDRDAALILDLGGDDLYRNNAGGSRDGMPAAVVIDWAGDDRYLARESFSQGAGLLGAGFLLDLAGRDLFVALDGSQGAGLLGIGVLRHDGERAIFRARRLCQGAGRVGLGLLAGGRGDTLYQGGEMGQGFGALGGAGVLVDEGGDDTYQLGGLRPDFRDPERATVSMGQGFGYGMRPEGDREGVSGGIGLLLDGGGDDTYLADYFAQGASYYFGLGILRDVSGDDRYLAGRYAQGAGIHASVGVLVDEAGNDAYHASVGVAQGLGHDYGAGLLQDEGGDDRYAGGSLLQGAATPGGLGLLLDTGGRNDFRAGEKARGYAEDETGLGIFLSY